MEKRWVIREESDSRIVGELVQSLTVSELLSRLLILRGVDNYETAERYFRPTIQHLHDPFLMKGMTEAIDRIEKAIANKERILVYGDYDVDGTTSVALVYTFFKKYYADIDFYIPNRYTEGYGISEQGVRFAAENGYTLIIALDCGIKAIEQVELAKTNGTDFIICDHHLPGESVPNACAVLDPKQNDCPYPYKELAGCGIGFKLIQAYAQRNGIAIDELMPYLDLVVVSIAADIVPITGENRVLAYYGLQQLNQQARPGLQALKNIAAIRRNLDVSDIVFYIGPRINAAGRINDAKDAVRLLIAENGAVAEERSLVVNNNNQERRQFDSNITAEALAILESDSRLAQRKTTVLYNPTWNKGVIGIVASRLVERYYRPTIVLTESNGKASGSARSVTGFDVYEAISACSDLLDQFGGHKYAAGLTLDVANVQAFTDKFEAVVASTITDRALTQEVEIDAQIRLEEITPKFFRILNQFAPFGPGNMRPIFLSKGVWCDFNPQAVGSNHLKFTIRQENSQVFECIGFGLGDYLAKIRKGIPFDICYTIEENEWNGQKTIQLNIKDLKLSS